MSAKHPIIAVTGSSGAGTTSVTRTFNWIFRREHINAVLVEGDSFHRYDRLEMKKMMAEASARGDHHFSHFGPENNLFAEKAYPQQSEQAFATYQSYVDRGAKILNLRYVGRHAEFKYWGMPETVNAAYQKALAFPPV